MKDSVCPQNDSYDSLKSKIADNPISKDDRKAEVLAELERGVHVALENYSNVHRGKGHNSMVTTHLFEQAREIVLAYLGLNKGKFTIVFCTPRRAEKLIAQLKPGCYKSLSSQKFGLPLGLRALAVESKVLPKGIPFQTGGGTARLVAPGWVVWSKSPDKFEAGTPAIVNIIAFAKALQLIRHYGIDSFKSKSVENQVVDEKIIAFDILHRDELEKYSGRQLLNELRKTLIGRNVLVPTAEGPKPYINLDNGASTPTFKPILNSVFQTWRQPSQMHKQIIQEVKSICSKVLGAPLINYDVLFTSNTTEAINLAAESLSNESGNIFEPVIMNTLSEHNSNELPWRMIPNSSIIRLSVDADGFVDLNEMEMRLREYNQEKLFGKKRIKIVAVSGASNVVGSYNNLAEISQIVHRYGAHLLVDAAQLVAHRKVDIAGCDIDYLAFSAHKVYAPFGSGVLVVRKELLNFKPSELELIQASGEENVIGIAALGKALVLLSRIGLDLIQVEEQALTRNVLHGLAQIPGIKIHGIKDPESPKFAQKGGVIPFSLKGIMAHGVAKKLTKQGGIGVRSGCHCAHLLVKRLLGVSTKLEEFQGLLVKMIPQLSLPGVVRVSLGIQNSEDEIERLVHVLGNIARKQPGGKDKQVTSTLNSSVNKTSKNVQKQMDDYVKAVSNRVYSPPL